MLAIQLPVKVYGVARRELIANFVDRAASGPFERTILVVVSFDSLGRRTRIEVREAFTGP
jgi:hypothetical protein